MQGKYCKGHSQFTFENYKINYNRYCILTHIIRNNIAVNKLCVCYVTFPYMTQAWSLPDPLVGTKEL